MPNGPMHGPRRGAPGAPRQKLDFKILGRTLGFIRGKYRVMLVVILLCQVLNAYAMVQVSTFSGVLIDDYILPLMGTTAPDFAPLLGQILKLAALLLVTLVGLFISGQLLAAVSQRVQKDVRDGMFAHMQMLPIKYFDTHTHGEVMSVYTNDTDTLRQLVSQTLPNVFSSAITIVSVFIAMVKLSLAMTGFVILTVVLMMLLTGQVGGRSMKHFTGQQAALAAVNGYVEEMLNGQKVVKVFCHEEAAKADFDRLNQSWYDSSCAANRRTAGAGRGGRN